MEFDAEMIDFGLLKNGDLFKADFIFRNALPTDSLFMEIVSACDCMDVKWPEVPIGPGEYGLVEVVYNTKDRVGDTFKEIDLIFKNTDEKGYPLVKRVWLRGKVE